MKFQYPEKNSKKDTYIYIIMIIPLTGGPPVHKLYPGMNNLKSAL
jgi:hypothetical protein